MKKSFQPLMLFMEVARQSNFFRVAENLNLPVSTVSRRIKALESELGVELFYRSSRRVGLTESGRQFFERCSNILADIDIAVEEVSQRKNTPKGLVRISLPGEIYYNYASEAFNSFALHWPEIQLHITLSSKWIDLYAEPYDVDLRVGPLPDSSLIASKLFTLKPALYASPKVLEKYPNPKRPEDIANMPCISLFVLGNIWALSRDGETVPLRISPRHMANSDNVACEMARAGLGVVLQVPATAQHHVLSGELVQILPEWRNRPADLNMVFASSQMPQRVRLLKEHLIKFFAQLPE